MLRGAKKAIWRVEIDWLLENRWGCRSQESVHGSRRRRDHVLEEEVLRRKSVEFQGSPIMGILVITLPSTVGGWAGCGLQKL